MLSVILVVILDSVCEAVHRSEQYQADTVMWITVLKSILEISYDLPASLLFVRLMIDQPDSSVIDCSVVKTCKRSR